MPSRRGRRRAKLAALVVLTLGSTAVSVVAVQRSAGAVTHRQVITVSASS